MRHEVSIIIASLRPNELKQCLESIHQCSAGIDYEVVVISPFDIEPHPRVVHIRERKPEGNYNAVAKGYRRAKGEYVVALSDDLVVTQGWLKSMVAFMRPHDNEVFQGRFRHMVAHGDVVLERPLMNYFGFMFSGFPCMRKDKLQEGGLFDNKLLHGFWGDPDLGLRVWTNGGRVETCQDSVIVAYPCLDELDRTSKEKWQEADGKAFCQRWEPTFGELFAIFDVYGLRIQCPKCGEEYRWHPSDKRHCWQCGRLAYPIMLKGGKAVASWVSIVVPHTGPVDLLRNCLEGIERNTTVPHDIIVIEDRADEETQRYLDSLSGDIEVVSNPELMGVEQALNNGFCRARGRHICMLTTSYELSPGSIDALKDALDEKGNEFGWVALPLEDRMAFVAGCSMMTSEAFHKVGPWDESYSVGYGFSDDDYMRRMWQAGYKPHIVDGPRMRHRGKTATEVVRGEEKAREGFARSQALFRQRYNEEGTNWDNFPVFKEAKVMTATVPDKNSWIRSRCSLGDTILDVGSADGWVWENQPYRVTLLDINEFEPHPKYPRVVGDAHNLPYGDNSFDIVVEGELLEHVHDPELCLREAVRVASKKVVLTVPAEEYWAPENRPYVPIEEVLKETGLTKEEQFKKDNPNMVKMHDLDQGYHRRHYTRELLEAQLKELQVPYRIELLRYSGWAFWVGEIYCNGGETVTIEKPTQIKLNLGSFVDTVNYPGWENLDILALRQHIPAEVKFKQWDLRRGIPWPDGSVDLIRCSHLLEHLTLQEAKNLVREMFRVLKPGGLARISTPDLDIILKHYRNRDMSFFNAIQPPEYIQAPTEGEKFSQLLFSREYEHKAAYNWEVLKSYLEQAGFTKVFRSVFGFSHSETIQQETQDQHPEESIFVEAVR